MLGIPADHGWRLAPLDLTAVGRAEDLLSEPPSPAVDAFPRIRFRTFFDDGEVNPTPAGVLPGQRLMGVRAEASAVAWSGTVMGTTELRGYGPPGPLGEPFDEASPHLLRVGAAGIWGWLDSGARFESVSRGLEAIAGAGEKTDREGGRGWVGIRLGAARLKASLGEFHTNVADDVARPRTTTTEGGLDLELTLWSASIASLGVHRTAEVWTPPVRGAGGRASTTDGDSIVAMLYHRGESDWEMTLSTRYTVTDTPRETASFSHDVSAAYRPTPALSIVPTLSLSETEPGMGAGSRY